MKLHCYMNFSLPLKLGRKTSLTTGMANIKAKENVAAFILAVSAAAVQRTVWMQKTVKGHGRGRDGNLY